MKKKAMPALPTPAPNYRAYQRIEGSVDGIVPTIHHIFDTTLPPTADDQAAWEKYCDVGMPRYRILAMQERLAALEPITNQYIQKHVDAIRTIHDRLMRFLERPSDFSVEEWQAMSEEDRLARTASETTEQEKLDLDRADDLWVKVVTVREILPAANRGLPFNHPREKDTPGKMRKLVKRQLKQELDAGMELKRISASYLWKVCRNLRASARYGYIFYESYARPMNESTDDHDVGFDRFSTILSEEKRPFK